MNTRKVSVVGAVRKTRFGVLVANLQKTSSPALVNHVVIKFSLWWFVCGATLGGSIARLQCQKLPGNNDEYGIIRGWPANRTSQVTRCLQCGILCMMTFVTTNSWASPSTSTVDVLTAHSDQWLLCICVTRRKSWLMIFFGHALWRWASCEMVDWVRKVKSWIEVHTLLFVQIVCQYS